MRPKNLVMCPDCGKPKMLFDTEKKAQNFLKFNGDAVNPRGDRTMRVYYCPACCGYHISSHEYTGSNDKTDRLIEAYKKDLETANKHSQEAQERKFLDIAKQEYEYMVLHGYTKDEARRHMALFNISKSARQVALRNYNNYLKNNKIGEPYKYDEKT